MKNKNCKREKVLSLRGIMWEDKKLIPYHSRNIKRKDIPRCKKPKERNASLSRLLSN